MERIPIYEVDTLPEEFREPNSKQSPQIKAAASRSITGSEPKMQPAQKPLQKTAKLPTLPNYPEKPTVYQLIAITKSNEQEKQFAYKYVFSLSSDTYKSLLAGGSIEPALINFILDSIIFKFNEAQITNEIIDKAISLLSVLPSVPRFSLVAVFADKEKIFTIKQKLTSHADPQTLESIFQKW